MGCCSRRSRHWFERLLEEMVWKKERRKEGNYGEDILGLVNHVGRLVAEKFVEVELGPLVLVVVGVAGGATGDGALGDQVVGVVRAKTDVAATACEAG